MTAIDSSEAAAQQNTKLMAATVQKLNALRPVDRQQALAECASLILEFATSLVGARRDKISAWTSLDIALQQRMKPGGVRAVALSLTGRARGIVLSEGRYINGQRNGFDDVIIAAAA